MTNDPKPAATNDAPTPCSCDKHANATESMATKLHAPHVHNGRFVEPAEPAPKPDDDAVTGIAGPGDLT